MTDFEINELSAPTQRWIEGARGRVRVGQKLSRARAERMPTIVQFGEDAPESPLSPQDHPEVQDATPGA